MAGNNKRVVKKSSNDVAPASAPETKSKSKTSGNKRENKSAAKSEHVQELVAPTSAPLVETVETVETGVNIINKLADADKVDKKARGKTVKSRVSKVAEIEVESSEHPSVSSSSVGQEAVPVPTQELKKSKDKQSSGFSPELEKELKFKETLNLLKTEIANYSKQLKELKSHLKKLELSYDHDIAKTLKMKPKHKRKSNDATGFIKQIALNKDLAELIGEQENTMMSMPEYTKKFFKMMKDHKLLYEGDKRIFRTNDRIKKVFNLPDNVNESINYRDKEGFNLYNLQTYISKVNDPVAYEKKHTNTNLTC